jgi:hypothetical protein
MLQRSYNRSLINFKKGNAALTLSHLRFRVEILVSVVGLYHIQSKNKKKNRRVNMEERWLGFIAQALILSLSALAHFLISQELTKKRMKRSYL